MRRGRSHSLNQRALGKMSTKHRPRSNAPAAISAILMTGLSIVVYCQYVFVSIGSVRLVQGGLAFAIICVECSSTRRAFSRFQVSWGALALLAGWVLTVFSCSEILARYFDDPGLARNLQLTLGVGPLYMALGWAIIGSSRKILYAQVYVLVSAVMALAALVEYISGQSLIGRAEFEYLAREGGVRALVASDHPLVLGGLLLAAMPLVYALNGSWRYVGSVVLLVGIWSTGSRGPLGIALIVFCVAVAPGLARLVRKLYRVVVIAIIALFVLVSVLAIWVWKPEIWGFSSFEYSTNYRFAIYALVPMILAQLPLGYIFGSIPPGAWVLPSEWRGLRDVSITVDSEVVLLVFQVGWLGLLSYVGLTMMCGLSLRYDLAVGGMALAVSLSGMFLALHAWDGLGAVWWVSIGTAAAVITNGRHANKMAGLHSKERLHPRRFSAVPHERRAHR